MAEYNEVIKQFKRMCKSVTPMKCTRGECPMGCENIGQCRKVAFEQPSCFEDIVMAWAAEHPEPVYPTWVEWLVAQDIITEYGRIECGGSGTCGIFTDKGENPIPADIAQKLGIEPKEG